ncbi:MAG: HEPN domain-containing protein [Nitrospira sp.]|nr:HEPN domain-containing protein [Nitrospira sp.]
MQPEKAAAVRGWLSKAADDLRGARIDLDANPPFIEDALFHCQQAAEKALKGFLTAHDTPFKKTHDLDELGRHCLEFDSKLADALQPAVPLTVFAMGIPLSRRQPCSVSQRSARIAGRRCGALHRRAPTTSPELPSVIDPLQCNPSLTETNRQDQPSFVQHQLID